jgi:hypothetical protein
LEAGGEMAPELQSEGQYEGATMKNKERKTGWLYSSIRIRSSVKEVGTRKKSDSTVWVVSTLGSAVASLEVVPGAANERKGPKDRRARQGDSTRSKRERITEAQETARRSTETSH